MCDALKMRQVQIEKQVVYLVFEKRLIGSGIVRGGFLLHDAKLAL